MFFRKKTRCSAIAERPRCTVRYSFRQKWKTVTGRQYFTDIIPLWYNRPENLANLVIKCRIRGITAFKVTQGHRGRYLSMRLPINDWLIVTDILSHTVSKLSQLIVQILHTLRFWATLWGDNVRCSYWAYWKARSGLHISVNWTFSLGVTAVSLRAKIGNFAAKRSLWSKISSRRGRLPGSHQSFLHG